MYNNGSFQWRIFATPQVKLKHKYMYIVYYRSILRWFFTLKKYDATHTYLKKRINAKHKYIL